MSKKKLKQLLKKELYDNMVKITSLKIYIQKYNEIQKLCEEKNVTLITTFETFQNDYPIFHTKNKIKIIAKECECEKDVIISCLKNNSGIFYCDKHLRSRFTVPNMTNYNIILNLCNEQGAILITTFDEYKNNNLTDYTKSKLKIITSK